jgi:chromosome segregation ATPase
MIALRTRFARTPKEPKTMPNAVAVVDVLEQVTHDVHEKAREAFARDLATYRAGCKAMAEHDGKLPEDEAAELLAVCQRLGIDPTRLAADHTAFIRLRNIDARVAEIEARNVARRGPLPGLAANLEEANAEFLRVQPECLRRIAQVEAAVNDARRAHDAVANLRDERTDNEQAEMRQVQDRFPHLFREMTADELRRYLARS